MSAYCCYIKCVHDIEIKYYTMHRGYTKCLLIEYVGLEPETFKLQAVTLRITVWRAVAKFTFGGSAGLMSDDAARLNHALEDELRRELYNTFANGSSELHRIGGSTGLMQEDTQD
jgi:hypothetical protein